MALSLEAFNTAVPAGRKGNKRQKAEEGAHSSGTGVGLQERVKVLEKVVQLHDKQLRQLEAMTTLTWILDSKDPVATALLAQMETYQAARPDKGAHPLGPPRRGLGLVLIEWGKTHPEQLPTFLAYHAQLQRRQDLQTRSTSHTFLPTFEVSRPFHGFGTGCEIGATDVILFACGVL
eukprot:3672040-Amphidinium_carterae.1